MLLIGSVEYGDEYVRGGRVDPSLLVLGSSNPALSSAESRKLPYRIKGMCPGGVVDQYHSHIRGVWRPDWSRAVGGDEYIEPKARGHTVDLRVRASRLTMRARSPMPTRRTFPGQGFRDRKFADS